MSRRTILFIHSSDPSDHVGGGEKSLLALAERLDRTRFEPIVAISGEGEFHDLLTEAGLDVRIVPMDPLYVTVAEAGPLALLPLLWRGLLSIVRLTFLLQEKSIDLVCTNVQGAHLYGGLAARLLGIPVIMYMRDIPQGGFSTRLFPWIGRYLAQRIICISGAVRRFFVDHSRHGEILAGKTEVVFNGIDLSALQPRGSSAHIPGGFGIGDEQPVVTLIGRLQPWKGQLDLIEAAPRIREAFPGVRILLVGNVFQFQEEFADRLHARVRELNLEETVLFLGQRSDVPELIEASDILVSASWHEPFGRVIIEAMALSRPVVGTRAGGIPDIIDEGHTGILVPVRCPHELAAAITRLAGNREEARRMGSAGRARVEALFSIDSTVAGASQVFATTSP